MEEANLKEVECPICLETLRKPIRMLECGHNFCHQCIESNCSQGQQNRCPSCRKSLSVSFDQSPRNFALENIIENMIEMDVISKPATSTTLVSSEKTLKQLEDAVKTHMASNEFNKALPILQTLIAQERGISRLLLMMKKIKCQIKTNEDATVNTCVEAASLLDHPNFQTPSTKMVDQSDNEIQLFVKSFIEIDVNTALLLQSCRFNLIQTFYKGKPILNKLRSIGEDMQRAVRKMKEQNVVHKFKEQYSLMDKIVNVMQNVVDEDVIFRNKEIAWFLNYYAYCGNELGDFDRSAKLLEQAITLLKTKCVEETLFSDRILPCLYNNCGIAYENLKKLTEAKQCFEKSKCICPQVKTFQTEVQKLECISTATEGLRRIETKLKRKKLTIIEQANKH